MTMTTAVFDHHVDPIHQPQFLAKRLPIPSIAARDGPAIAKQLIRNALTRRVEVVDHELCEPGDEDTFFVADLGDVYRQHLRWKKNLPRVRPFYGMSILFSASPRSARPFFFSLLAMPVFIPNSLSSLALFAVANLHSRQMQPRPYGPSAPRRPRHWF